MCVCVRVARGYSVSWLILHCPSIHSVCYKEHVFFFIFHRPYQSRRSFVGGGNSVEGGEVFQACTRWMDASVIVRITIRYVSGFGPFRRECEAGSNLPKSLFHLSLEQTGAGELTPIYHWCKIPEALIWSLNSKWMSVCRVFLFFSVHVCVCVSHCTAVQLYSEERLRFAFLLHTHTHSSNLPPPCCSIINPQKLTRVLKWCCMHWHIIYIYIYIYIYIVIIRGEVKRSIKSFKAPQTQMSNTIFAKKMRSKMVCFLLSL